MQGSFNKRIAVSVAAIIVIVVAVVYGQYAAKKPPVEAPKPVVVSPDPRISKIGSSVEGRAIESYAFGKGPINLAFVGGIHGGYEWNSVLLAYQFIDYFTAHPELIPPNVTVNIIPSANPDGVYKVIGVNGRFALTDVPADDGTASGLGRFNANNVDLNRNFDCKWKPESMWRSKKVSAGTSAFSEPEARAVRDFVATTSPSAVVFWHSQANAVYASECQNGILPKTLDLMNKYSVASGYKAVSSFDSYEVTGDAEGWLASIGIPAITVELSTHATLEWEKNLAGVKAILESYKGSI
ncbi:MAG: M14 family metallopeptidase [Patescibacteria group bacterium]